MFNTLWILVVCLIAFCEGDRRAQCDLEVNSAESGLADSVTGTVTFDQDGSDDNVDVTIVLSGFSTSDSHSQHGFHVHADAVTDGANDCSTAGGHYNPDGNTHGAQTASAANRHVGDLGNIIEDGNGEVGTSLTDQVISLYGEQNIIGRTVVVHQEMDTLDESEDASGGAGTRIACCVIYEVDDDDGATTAILSFTTLAASLLVSCFV